MNSVQIIGNLARDPVVRATKTGRAVASFTVAVSRNFTTPQGEQKEITDWINVVAWGNLAESVGNQLRKGMRVFVEGRYTTRSYDAQDGQRKWVTEVTANMVAMPLASSPRPQPQNGFGGQSYGNNGGFTNGFGGGQSYGGFGNPTPAPAPAYGNESQQPQAQPKSGFGQFGTPSNEEEIPF